MLQHLGVQLLLAERQPPGGAAAATKSAAATDAVAAASTGAGNVQASLPSASPQPQQPVASSGPGPRVTDLKSNEQHHQPQQSGGSKNSTDGQQLKKPSRKGRNGASSVAILFRELSRNAIVAIVVYLCAAPCVSLCDFLCVNSLR